MKVYQAIAHYCHVKSKSVEIHDMVEERYQKAIENAPSGSGFDNGTVVVEDESSSYEIALETAFHHMDGNGCYEGWTEHKLTVSYDLMLDSLIVDTITGEDRNDIHEYITETVLQWLTGDIS